MKITPDDKLMDLGGGTGLLALKFKNQLSKITVVDTSEAMLDVLRAKIKQQQITNVEIFDKNLVPGAFPEGSFDLVISMLTLHHVQDLDLLFETFSAMLTRHGHIALVDLAKEEGDFHQGYAEYVYNGFEPETLKEPLKKAGFRDIKIDEKFSVTREFPDGSNKEYPLLMITASRE
ncbi:MAG: class I SAM-dependent methyltransferase [Proteobacteria bacterium]|nr:class I SAM-dependent methyltransferase [Pseudomonadota bacterium]